MLYAVANSEANYPRQHTKTNFINQGKLCGEVTQHQQNQACYFFSSCALLR